MMIKRMLKSVAAASVFMALAAGSATAQACEAEKTFSAANYEFYGKAETELLVNKNPNAALSAYNQLKNMPLTCFEEGAALRLASAIKFELNDINGAVRDLETAVNKGYITGKDRTSTYFTMSQMYLKVENSPKALEYYDKWINAGGSPTRDQAWTLAILNQRLDRNQESLKWAEQVFRADGPNAKDEVYKFLLYLYEKTGNLTKKAQLIEQMLARNPKDMTLWEAIRGDYYRGGDERKAFEVQKAMYLGGLLTEEKEIMRVVEFYNQFNAPYQAAKVLEKEMNAGRVKKSFAQMERLANLYQVAREYKKAIPVIEEAARMSPNGGVYERLGRSYSELKQWDKAEEAMQQAINKGGLKDKGAAWVSIGQARYERDDRAGAREAFRNANSRAGRSWLDFMQSEEDTAFARKRFDLSNSVKALKDEKKRCEQIAVLSPEPTEACASVDARITEAQAALAAFTGGS